MPSFASSICSLQDEGRKEENEERVSMDKSQERREGGEKGHGRKVTCPESAHGGSRGKGTTVEETNDYRRQIQEGEAVRAVSFFFVWLNA
mmetsp:Transcript_40247/g.79373  ORF Transcript_40247/g.79373 Transcript_40247/m.79373 type:complete len:90 (+) Transcript_40247:1089-1358(+)